jgi:2-polyprenyl-6-methoxyphenol hydroxylase-like FAD-dependent oxidoreductase
MTGDVAIIGAGPAGSACAILLARRGWSVTLIEQHRFPRDKVCGECLSAFGLEALDRMGMLGAVRSLDPVVLTHTDIHTSSGRSIRMRLPRPMLGISRRLFDQCLLDAAREAGATILQPARCEAVEAGEPITIRVRRLPSNQIETLHPQRVIIADGKSALPGQAPPQTGDFGIKTHFENVEGPRDTIELFGCQGLYGGLAAIEGNRWNAAFSVPAHRLRQHRGNVAALFNEIVKENSVLAQRLSKARQASDWLAAPLPRFPVQNHWLPNIFPVGNSAAALEPIGGEGMGLALRSAELLVEAMDESDIHSVYDRYCELWRVRRPSCRLAAQIALRPGLADLLLPQVARIPAVASRILSLLGK